jgi:hypothetical protein
VSQSGGYASVYGGYVSPPQLNVSTQRLQSVWARDLGGKEIEIPTGLGISVRDGHSIAVIVAENVATKVAIWAGIINHTTGRWWLLSDRFTAVLSFRKTVKNFVGGFMAALLQGFLLAPVIWLGVSSLVLWAAAQAIFGGDMLPIIVAAAWASFNIYAMVMVIGENRALTSALTSHIGDIATRLFKLGPSHGLNSEDR